MKKIISILLIIFLLAGCAGTAEKTKEKDTAQKMEGKEITVSAAASLTDALTELSKIYQEETGAVVNLNFAASGALQKQIEEGAPVDIFISAAKDNMDKLEGQDLIIKDSRRDLLKNALVLIANKENADKVKDLESFTAGEGMIAIGEPDSVPAGKYAREAMENLGVYDQLEKKDRIIFCKDVKQVLNYVESGDVECGIVYTTDGLVAKDSNIVETINEELYSEIVYPAALLKDNEAARGFFELIISDKGKEVFEKYGFTFVGNK